MLTKSSRSTVIAAPARSKRSPTAPRWSRAASEKPPHRRRDGGLACLLVAWPCGFAVPAKGSPTADAADPRGRPVGRASRCRARGHGRERRRRAQGTTAYLCHFADGAYEAADAPESDFYGPDAEGHGRDSQDIVPPFVIESPRPDDPSSFDGRHWDNRGQAILDAGCDEAPPEPGPTPEPEKRSGSATRRARRRIRTSQEEPAIANNGDLNGGHLEPHRPRVSRRTAWGDIIPPYVYVGDKDGQTSRSPATTGGRGRAGDLRERLRATRAAYSQEGHPPPRMRRTARRRQVPRPLGLREQERHDRRGDGRPEHVLARPPGPWPADGVRGRPRRGCLPGRVRRLRAHLVAHREQGVREQDLGESAPAARSRSRSGSSPRTTPAASRCGSTARSAAAPRPSAMAGRRERSRSRRAAAR